MEKVLADILSVKVFEASESLADCFIVGQQNCYIEHTLNIANIESSNYNTLIHKHDNKPQYNARQPLTNP